MSFKTYTEEEAKANSRTLLPKGIYPFSIHAAYDQESAEKGGGPLISSKGNAMIALKLHVHREDGGVQFVDCFIVDTPKMAWMARQLAAETGTLGEYNAGSWGATTLEGRQGYVRLDVEAEKAKDPANPTGDKYPAKNVVKGYGQDDGKSSAKASGNQPAFPAMPARTQPQTAAGNPAGPDGSAFPVGTGPDADSEVPF
jgi:hypothetical protein